MRGGLMETNVVPDIFCSGIGEIERLDGNCFRLYFYVTQRTCDDGVSEERLVVTKIIMPAVALADAIMKMMEPANEEKPAAVVALLRGLVIH